MRIILFTILSFVSCPPPACVCNVDFNGADLSAGIIDVDVFTTNVEPEFCVKITPALPFDTTQVEQVAALFLSPVYRIVLLVAEAAAAPIGTPDDINFYFWSESVSEFSADSLSIEFIYNIYNQSAGCGLEADSLFVSNRRIKQQGAYNQADSWAWHNLTGTGSIECN